MPTIAEVREKFPQYNDLSDEQLASALHQKFYADMPADQFNASIGLKGKQPDQYQQAAIDEQAALKSQGIDPGAGFTRRLTHGMTLGADNTLIAGVLSPIEAFRRNVGLAEGYKYAKAREDKIMEDARKNTGVLGTAAEVLGGGAAGAGLAAGGVTAARLLGPEAGLLARTGASAADAAALGGFSGAMEGNGLAERAGNAAIGAGVGGAVGAAAPGILSMLGAVASPVVSNIRARTNPEGYARSQVARAVSESGQSPNDISLNMLQAANDGQGMFTLADALGNSGQRMLSTVARAPGAGRTAVVDVLEGRQSEQGRRIAAALSEGFQAPETAAQTEARMLAARNRQADAEYNAVRGSAADVDVSRAVAAIDREIGHSGANRFNSGLANDSGEAALESIRRRLTDGNLTVSDFTATQRVRGDLSDAIEAARRSGANNKARMLGNTLRELDAAMEAASPGFRDANRNFAQATRDIEAIQTGRAAATRGRPEDTIPTFSALSPRGQEAFLAGYADPLIASTQGAAPGVNKARPLLNDAFRDEAAMMAPGNDMLQRRLARENTMFETRAQALGGSKTAENLADQAAMGVDPSIIRDALTGNYGGVARRALGAVSNGLSGNTPEVRAEIARQLLQNGANVSPAALQQMVDQTIARQQFVQQIARALGRGGSGGLAIATPNANRRQ